MDDTLTIDIESTNDASGGIDNLISKLEALKVKINENLKAIGRLNSAFMNMGNFSSKLKDIKTPTQRTTQTSTTTKEVTPQATVQTQAQDAKKSIDEMLSLQRTIDAINKKQINVDTTPLKMRINEISKELNTTSMKFDDLRNNAEKVSSVQSHFSKLRNTISKIPNALKTISTGMLTVLSNGKKLAGGLVNAFSRLKNIGKNSADSTGTSFKNLVKALRQTGLALLGVRGMFTALRKATSAYMNYDTELSKTLQNNWAVLGSLLAPILERIISLFSTAVAYINAFVKALFGVDLVARANAKALKSQASGASGASKAVKKLADELGNLQKFDDLNVVDFPKDTGGSSGGGGAGLAPLKVDTISVKPLEDFLKYLKDKDWYGIGMEIARKFNDGLRLIDFDWLEAKARQWGKNMGDLFNGLTDGLDWALVGEKIAGGLNTVMGFVNTFFDTYNFDHLGEGLARGMNSLVDTVHWDDIGQFLTNKISALFETVSAFAQNFNWRTFGKSVGDAINSAVRNINLGTASKALSTTIQGMLDAVGGMIYSVDWEGLAESINSFIYNMDLSSVAEKINETLSTGYEALVTFLQTMDWNALGEQIGEGLATIDWIGLIIKGTSIIKVELPKLLWKFVIGLIKGIFDTIKTELSTKFKELKNNVVDYFEGIGESISDWWKGLKTWFSDRFSSAKTWIGDKLTSIKDSVVNKFVGIRNGIKDSVTSAVTWIKDKFSWGNIKNTFETIKTNIGTKFSDIKSSISDKATSASNTLKNAFKWDNIKSTFTNLVTKIKDKFGEIGTTVGTVLSSKFNEIVSKIVNKAVDVINGFIKAINKAIGAINKIPGVDLKKLDTIDYPKLATGTNKIEVEGLYHLHQGEAVVPKKYNPAVNNKMYSENNDKMLTRMDNLIELLNNMEMTNIVNVGNDQLYKGTVQYINRQRDIYGTDVV